MKYITKKQVLEEGEKYGVKITNRRFQYYKDISLIRHVKYGFYREDTPKIFYVLKRIRQIPYPIKFEQFKFYLDLLLLNDEKWQKIKWLKQENETIESYIALRGITPKIIEKMQIYYSAIYYETILSRLEIFKDILGFRAIVEIWDSLKALEEGKSRKDLVLLENVRENPAIDIDEKSRHIAVKFDVPVSSTVIFKENYIKVE